MHTEGEKRLHAATVEERGDSQLGWKATGVAAEDAQPAASHRAARAPHFSPYKIYPKGGRAHRARTPV
jgi:hypothetical protein